MAHAVHGEVVPAAGNALPVVRTQASIDSGIPMRAVELVLAGIPENTQAAYRKMWSWHVRACARLGRTSAPVTEDTMLTILAELSDLPIEAARGERKRWSPSTVWIWYSAVKRYHSMSSPVLPWQCGSRLSLAIMGYTNEMFDAGWKPKRAPRAYPQDVRRMVDWLSLDLDRPRNMIGRALVLADFHTAGRSADLAYYRMSDVAFVPYGMDMELRRSKNLKAGKSRVTAVYANEEKPQYCPVLAVRDLLTFYNARGITRGPLFTKTLRWGGLATVPADFRLTGQALTNTVSWAAAGAGLDARYTCHSLRRGWVTLLRELGEDFLAIARAYGWSERGSLHVYMEEAERGSDTAVARRVML